MRYRGQTSIEYLILTAGVMLIVLVAGYGALSSADSRHSTIKTIEGAGVAPPDVTFRESDLPPVHPPSGGSHTPSPPPQQYLPRVSCQVSYISGPDPSTEIGGTLEFNFTANRSVVNLDWAEVNAYLREDGPLDWQNLDNYFVDRNTYDLPSDSGSGTYQMPVNSCGNYRFVVAVYNVDGDVTTCSDWYRVPCESGGADSDSLPSPSLTRYFSSCYEITRLLTSSEVRNAVQDDKYVFLIQDSDIDAEPKSNGDPREACIHVEDYDYDGYVYVFGGGAGIVKDTHTLYIPATRGICFPGWFVGGFEDEICIGGEEYSAYRAVYLKNVKGLHFVNMRLDCATKWETVDSRKPCVDLENSSASFMDSNILDFGTVISGISTAIPVRLKSSTMFIDNGLSIVDLRDIYGMRNHSRRDVDNVFFVLEGASDLNMSSDAIVSIKAHPDS